MRKRDNSIKDKFYSNMAVAVEGIISRKDTALKLDYPVIHYGIINWGYGWIFPKRDVLVVGIVGLKNKNGNFNNIFEDYLNMLKIDIENVEYNGWPLPYGNYITNPVFKKTFLAGDAAGVIIIFKFKLGKIN